MPAGRVAGHASRGHQLRAARARSARATSTTRWRWRRAWVSPGRTWWSATSAGASPGPCSAACRATHGPDRLFGALEFRDAIDHPRIADPPVGRLWTANQRVVDGRARSRCWATTKSTSARAATTSARARGRSATTCWDSRIRPPRRTCWPSSSIPARCSSARWRELLLALIDEDAMHDAPQRREFRELVSDWRAEAAPDSVGYRLVRTFRSETLDALWHSLGTGLLGEEFEGRRPAQFEATGWRLVNEQPAGIAPPGGGDWREFLLARAGRHHRGAARPSAAVSRPANSAIAIRSRCAIRCRARCRCWPRLLDMPTLRLPGDHHMPRVQDGAFGASERFAVSPGRESEGYLQLPGGPSGHPLSPFYRSGFDDWAAGRAHAIPARARQRISCCCGRPAPHRPDRDGHEQARFTGTERYVATPDLMMAVNAAVTLGTAAAHQGRARHRQDPARGGDRAFAGSGRCTSGTSSRPARRSRACTNTTPCRACAIRSSARRSVRDIRNYIIKGSLWEAFESRGAAGAAHRRDRQGRHRVSQRPAARARPHGVLRARDARAGEGAPPAHHPDHQQQREGTARRVPAPLLLPLHPVSRRGDHGEDRPGALPRASRRSCCAKR